MGFDWQEACQKQWNKMSDNWQSNSREMWEEGRRNDRESQHAHFT